MTKPEKFFDSFADIPWGVLLFAVVVILTAIHRLHAEDIRAVSTAAGLLGIGHGIHTASKHLPNSKTRASQGVRKPRSG